MSLAHARMPSLRDKLEAKEVKEVKPKRKTRKKVEKKLGKTKRK